MSTTSRPTHQLPVVQQEQEEKQYTGNKS